jgi:antitoxin component of RelBE/YafQ-DinJ toxin-antitoxin module
MATTMVHCRVDENAKQRGAKALPFDVKVPNATTVKAMRAADRGKGKRLKSAGALFKELGV